MSFSIYNRRDLKDFDHVFLMAPTGHTLAVELHAWDIVFGKQPQGFCLQQQVVTNK
jgi:hypothetical protein